MKPHSSSALPSGPGSSARRPPRGSEGAGPSSAAEPEPRAEARTDLLPVGPGERDIRRKRPPALSFLLRMDTARRLVRVLSLLVLDFAGVTLAILTALSLKAALRVGELTWSDLAQETRQLVPFAFLVTALLFARSGLYSEHAQRPGTARIVASLCQVTFVALIFALVSGQEFSSYYIFYGSLAFALVYISAFRYAQGRATEMLMRAAGQRRRTVLVGSEHNLTAVARALAGGTHRAIELVGFLTISGAPASRPVALEVRDGLHALGALPDLGNVLRNQRIDEVIITDPDFPEAEAVELVESCHQRGVRVRIAPSTMDLLVHRAEFVPGESVPLFELEPPVFEGIDFALKRTFDVVVSAILLILLSPLLIAITVAVRLTSRGPILYRSMRRGIGQAPFACLKFRTMYEDAEQEQQILEEHNEASGALFKIRHDPRVTPVGALLRRFSLDELPQLINVLRGEMSLVGPRPLPERDYQLLEDWHRKRYLVLPGMTGLWQVSGRSELDFDDLVRLDFLYLERWSLALDFTVLLRTVPAVITRRGAY